MIVSSCLKFLFFVRKFHKSTDISEGAAIYRDKYLLATIFSVLPVNISRILSIFGSDKNQPGQHSYGNTYQELFQKMRYKPVKLLEIGLLYGNSLLTWRWFFPFATLIGIDISPQIKINGKKSKYTQAVNILKNFLGMLAKKRYILT